MARCLGELDRAVSILRHGLDAKDTHFPQVCLRAPYYASCSNVLGGDGTGLRTGLVSISRRQVR
jgi:hypothetical protein